MIDVAKALNVDFNVVSSLAHEVIKEDSSIKFILGQLVDHSYTVHIAEEINDRLQQHGLISITELARTFDLPGDFIHSVLFSNSVFWNIIPKPKICTYCNCVLDYQGKQWPCDYWSETRQTRSTNLLHRNFFGSE